MVKLFVERRFLALHSYCTLYLLYLFSCNTRHSLKPQQEACLDHILHQQKSYNRDISACSFNLGFYFESEEQKKIKESGNTTSKSKVVLFICTI